MSTIPLGVLIDVLARIDRARKVILDQDRIPFAEWQSLTEARDELAWRIKLITKEISLEVEHDSN